MIELPFQILETYRAQTFRTAPGLRITSPELAVQYVNERGFIFFWPIKEMLLPSLWIAAAGDRPVADEHDDPGHVTWGWKDSLLGKRQWYYARTLRRRNTIISLEAAPYFYALSENFGSPEEDYLLQYEQGRMTLEAKLVYEAILNIGPLDTVALRKAARLASRESDGRFNKALDDLQKDFKILPVGIAEAGAWKYAFIYDITARHLPEIQDQARYISEKQARYKLAELYLLSLGAVQLKEFSKLFGWKANEVEQVVEQMTTQQFACKGIRVSGATGEWVVLSRFMQNGG